MAGKKMIRARQVPPASAVLEMSTQRSLTSPTLLGRLSQNPRNELAWQAFVQRYGPKIYGWSLQWPLQEADAEDVPQNVLVRLARTLRSLGYDPARIFRGWLRLITQHALADFLADRKCRENCSGGPQITESSRPPGGANGTRPEHEWKDSRTRDWSIHVS
jgi:DNA-directed RNA polymerase specialized sigma24 family protein